MRPAVASAVLCAGDGSEPHHTPHLVDSTRCTKSDDVHPGSHVVSLTIDKIPRHEVRSGSVAAVGEFSHDSAADIEHGDSRPTGRWKRECEPGADTSRI